MLIVVPCPRMIVSHIRPGQRNRPGVTVEYDQVKSVVKHFMQHGKKVIDCPAGLYHITSFEKIFPTVHVACQARVLQNLGAPLATIRAIISPWSADLDWNIFVQDCRCCVVRFQ